MSTSSSQTQCGGGAAKLNLPATLSLPDAGDLVKAGSFATVPVSFR